MSVVASISFPHHSEHISGSGLYIRLWKERLRQIPSPSHYSKIQDSKSCKILTKSGWDFEPESFIKGHAFLEVTIFGRSTPVPMQRTGSRSHARSRSVLDYTSKHSKRESFVIPVPAVLLVICLLLGPNKWSPFDNRS